MLCSVKVILMPTDALESLSSPQVPPQNRKTYALSRSLAITTSVIGQELMKLHFLGLETVAMET